MRLGEELENLLERGPDNSHFNFVLKELYRGMKNGTVGTNHETRGDIKNFDMSHDLIDFIPSLTIWYEKGEYRDGAKPALEGLRKAIDFAIEEDWPEIFTTLITVRIELLSELNHRESLEAEINLAICYLSENGPTIAIRWGLDLVDAIIDNIKSIPRPESVQLLLDYLEGEQTNPLTPGDFKDNRDYFRRSLAIRKGKGIKPEIAKSSIIQSYSDEIKENNLKDKQSMRAIVAKEAIVECKRWISESQRIAWESDFIEGNKNSIQQMGEVSHEPDEDEINELDEYIEQFVNDFREMKKEHHAIFAIKWLLNQKQLIPSVDTIKEVSENSILNRVQRRSVSNAGESYSNNGIGNGLPASYGAMVQFSQTIRQTIYYRLQNRGLIKEGDLYVLFSRRAELSVDTKAYLTDFIINLYDHNHTAAIHIGMGQLESVIRTLSAENGKSILTVHSETGDLGRKSLGGLVYQLEGEVDESWLSYFKYWYVDLAGLNLRNQIAHGYLPYKNTSWGMSIIILFDILRAFLIFEEAYPNGDNETSSS